MLVVGLHQQTFCVTPKMPLRSDVPLLECLCAHSCWDGISGFVWELLPAGSWPGSSSSRVPLLSMGGEAAQTSDQDML